jgi:hypothetical protein
VKVEPGTKLLTVSFVADEETGQRITIVFYPDDHEIYLGTTYAMRSRIVPRGIPYDGFTSTTPRDLSTPSSPPSPSKGRKLD